MTDRTSNNLARVARAMPREDLGGRRALAAVEPAVVASFTGGVLQITYHGTTTAVAYLSSYTPVAGETVAVLVQDNQLLVIGKPIGTP